MAKKYYNDRGEQLCADEDGVVGHDFEGGLCKRCLCSDGPKHRVRAENAFYNMEALVNQYSEVLGYTPTREEAIFEAWRSHREQ